MRSAGCPYSLCSLSELNLSHRAFLDKKELWCFNGTSGCVLWSQSNRKSQVTKFFPMGHWPLVINWHFICDTVHSFEIWKYSFREWRKGGSVEAGNVPGHLICSDTFLPNGQQTRLAYFLARVFSCLCSSILWISLHTGNPPPSFSSQVVLLALMFLLQTWWFGLCICSSVMFCLPEKGIMRDPAPLQHFICVVCIWK